MITGGTGPTPAVPARGRGLGATAAGVSESSASIEVTGTTSVLQPSNDVIEIIGAKIEILSDDKIQVGEAFARFPDKFSQGDHGFTKFSKSRMNPGTPAERIQRQQRLKNLQLQRQGNISPDSSPEGGNIQLSEVQNVFDEFKPK